MSSEVMLRTQGLGKDYLLHVRTRDRLRHLLFSRGEGARVFQALRDINLEMRRGDSLGIIGQNGAGKSTLLQLLCGTLTPTRGTLEVRGRIAPILELGAGFNMDFTGRENIFMNAAVLGLSEQEVRERLSDIIAFADIGQFIDQPVRTYSSGMYVRLAFAIATRINPDILVIDEAISVGDGQFARKSFERILQLREQGVTLLFCSHALYQVEALCERALWLHHGEVRALGPAAQVVSEYTAWLDGQRVQEGASHEQVTWPAAPSGHARFSDIEVTCDGVTGRALAVQNNRSRITVLLRFASDPSLPTPTLLVLIHGANGMVVTSTGTHIDGVVLTRSAGGTGGATLVYEPALFLKGICFVSVYLMCERGIYVYDVAERHTTLNITQEHLELGMVSLPHQWQDGAA